jgi:hypothetical protein
MTRKCISFTLLIIILLSSLSLIANGSTFNNYNIQAAPITAETPKVTLGQGNAGTSTIYTNNTSARASVGINWLTGWTYRKSHIISYAASAGTNYQIRIKVYYGSGVDSGENVYSNGKCRTDFGDIRFASSNGTTILNCWMETKVDSSNAVFWVRVIDDLSAVNAVIYVYYGKADAAYPYLASARAHGDATFLFFDDFSVDLSRWNREKTSGVYPQIPSGTDYVRCGGGSTSSPYGHTSIGSSPTYSTFLNGAIEFSLRTTTNALGEVVYRGNYASNTGYKARYDCRSGTEQSFMKPPYSGWSGFGPTVTRFGDGTGVWYRGTVTVSGSTFRIYKDGVLENTATDATYSSSGEIALQNHYGIWTDYDWIAVRKFVDTEPGHGAWGSEESDQTFDYVLRVVNQVSYSWNIRLKAYDQTNMGRLSNCTIYFRNSTGVSRQIYVYSGAYSQQVGSWFNLTSLSTIYIAISATANTTGTSSIIAYLEVLIPNTSTSNLMVVTFEAS